MKLNGFAGEVLFIEEHIEENEMKYSNKEIQKIIPYENWYIDELRVMFVGKSDARKYAAENMKELGKTDEEIFRATGIKIK